MKFAIIFILQNFPLVMLLLSILIAFSKSGNFFNRLCWALFIFPVGFGGIWGFMVHTFYSEIAAANIGGQTSTFEYETAIANLSIGITGIIASFAGAGYKKATATLVSIFLFGTSIGRIQQIILQNNIHTGNAWTLVWTNILIPIILWLAILCARDKQPNKINWVDH